MIILFIIGFIVSLFVWYRVGYETGYNKARELLLEDLKKTKEVLDNLLKEINNKVELN